MDEVRLSDAGAQRLGRFFADLMLTLAEDGMGGAESADAVRALWRSTAAQPSPMGRDIDADTLVHGLGGVAAALADQLARERRTAGQSDASVVEVWHEVGRALDLAAFCDEESGNGTLDGP